MTQKEKDLLLRDLCERLPYNVKISIQYNNEEFIQSHHNISLIGTLDAVYPNEERVIVDELNQAIAHCNVRCGGFLLEHDIVKPYLRPMSSMTEEESKEYRMFIDYSYNDFTSESFPCVYVENVNNYLDWLNAHHFDYRGLIPMGLALPAPKDMYNIKDK